MDTPRAHHASFTIEREYRASTAKVYEAFADPVRKRRWFAESEGFEVDRYELDFRVGGFERSGFRTLAGSPLPAGTLVTNETVFFDLVPGRRIVFAYSMAMNGACISASLATFELIGTLAGGTRLHMTEQAAFFENADGPQMREQGWQSLLASLERELDAAGAPAAARARG